MTLTTRAAWLSYDSVAETYERAAVPWFEPMARDLIRAAGLSSGDRVLDVGTGSGLTADLARALVGSSGLALGIDPSLGMLKLACSRRGVVTTAAMVPGLPFPDGLFDAVVANLVISHVPDLTAGLEDMVRVLGTLSLSAPPRAFGSVSAARSSPSYGPGWLPARPLEPLNQS